MSDPKKKEEPAVIAMIAGFEKGAAVHELEAAIREATQAAMLTRKPATVALKFIIAGGDGDSVRVGHDIEKKIPKLPRKSQTYFVGEDGELSRSSKSQDEFPETRRAEAEAEVQAMKNRPGFRVMKADGSIATATATA